MPIFRWQAGGVPGNDPVLKLSFEISNACFQRIGQGISSVRRTPSTLRCGPIGSDLPRLKKNDLSRSHREVTDDERRHRCVSPLRGAGLLRCASSRRQRPSVSPLTGGYPSRHTVRPAMPAVTRARPLPVPVDRGPCFLHGYVNEARLPNWPAFRSRRCARFAARRPDRHPGHPPCPMPGR